MQSVYAPRSAHTAHVVVNVVARGALKKGPGVWAPEMVTARRCAFFIANAPATIPRALQCPRPLARASVHRSVAAFDERLPYTRTALGRPGHYSKARYARDAPATRLISSAFNAALTIASTMPGETPLPNQAAIVFALTPSAMLVEKSISLTATSSEDAISLGVGCRVCCGPVGP